MECSESRGGSTQEGIRKDRGIQVFGIEPKREIFEDQKWFIDCREFLQEQLWTIRDFNCRDAMVLLEREGYVRLDTSCLADVQKSASTMIGKAGQISSFFFTGVLFVQRSSRLRRRGEANTSHRHLWHRCTRIC